MYIRFIYADRSPEHLERAKDAVDRSATIGADLAETHITRGDYAYWGLGDYTKALEEFKAALALQPSSTDTIEVTGYVLRRQGRWEEAANQLRKWVEIDPRNPLALYQYGLTCANLRLTRKQNATSERRRLSARNLGLRGQTGRGFRSSGEAMSKRRAL